MQRLAFTIDLDDDAPIPSVGEPLDARLVNVEPVRPAAETLADLRAWLIDVPGSLPGTDSEQEYDAHMVRELVELIDRQTTDPTAELRAALRGLSEYVCGDGEPSGADTSEYVCAMLDRLGYPVPD